MNLYTDKKLNRNYRYKKRNKKARFVKLKTITIMVLLLVTIVGSTNMILGSNKALGSSTRDFKPIRIKCGDNLWSIVQEYKAEDISTRQAIYEITKINNISANELREGMILKIPVDLIK